jgi:dihydrofolate reductase
VRKIINSTYITLDGVIRNPQDWPSLGSFSDQGNAIQTDLILGCDAVIMGRDTYESFAPAWMSLSGDPLSDRMNAIPKYVVSTTLSNPEWNNTTVISRDPIGTIRALKQQDGANIAQYGFGQLAHELMANGLLDELRLWVHPFFVGSGEPDGLLHRSGSTGMFEHGDTTTLANGIVILTYRLAQA